MRVCCQQSRSKIVDGELSFVDLKYMAGLDWSKKFVKPMNIDFALKLYRSLPSYVGDLNLKLPVINGSTKPTKGIKSA